MNLLGSMAVAFSMYSRIPVPQVKWTKERMEYAMCFFPLIGAVIGSLLVGLWKISEAAGLSVIARSCFGTVLPVVVTGGIHMDGFADTVDALSSCQPKEKKLEILKDPHAGAFAIIGIVSYMMVFFGLFAELSSQGLLLFASVPVMSRALSGLSVVSFPKAKKSGLAAMFADSSKKMAVGIAMVLSWIIAAAWFFVMGGIWTSVILMGISIAGFGAYYALGKRAFGGITGDVAGYFLQLEELLLLFGIAAAGKIELF
ncbi:adenosylcobinamide-GDP ribazoletransferase [Lachnospiraceae bacterium 62-35]